jgi:hypothetical protein
LYQLNRSRQFSSFFSPARFTSVQLTSSPPFPLVGAASPSATLLRHVTFHFHGVKTISLSPLQLSATLHSVAAWVEIEALNSHRRRKPPSLDNLTLSLHCYKKVISTLVSLPTTQLYLYFASFLARAPRHRSFIRPIVLFHRRSMPIVHPYNDTHGDLSHSYDIHLKFYFHHCVLCDEMDKSRFHLHMFSKNN